MSLKRFGGFGLALVLLVAGSAVRGADAPLADAAEHGDRARVRALLEQRANVNQTQVDGMTALHWAAYHDDVEAAKLLVNAKADANAANRYGVTPLALACTNGDEAMVALLLDAGADPNTKLRGDETVLMTAARTGQLGPVKVLLARGADLNAKERRGQTALLWAASEGHASVVEALIQAGADFRAALPSGFTPLFFAVREGRTEVVRTLLKAGADINEAFQAQKPATRGPARGTSPLVLAIENGHFELAVMLLEAGADPNDQRSGYSPLHTLIWVRKPNRGDEADGDPIPIGSGNVTSLELVGKLVEHGANVNARLARGSTGGPTTLGRLGATPFFMASKTADVPYMRTLLELGADPLIRNADHASAIMAAAGIGNPAPGEEAGTEDEVLDAIELLVELGDDVNAVADNGETAMHGASYKQLPRVVLLLAEKGARIDVWHQKNKYGRTPITIAEGYRQGNFRPSLETLAAFHRVMREAGVTPPPPTVPPTEERKTYSP